MSRTTVQKLHDKLLTMGLDVYEPKRIWLGQGHNSGDLWRWEAGEKISNGGSSIGCNISMRECLQMKNSELKMRLEHSATGKGLFRSPE